MKRNLWYWACLPLLAFCMQACSDDNEDTPLEPTEEEITISTPQVSGITHEQATVQARISGSNSGIESRGFCYATSAGPDINDQTVNLTTASSNMECTLTALTAETMYYVRAFVTLSDGSAVYSAETSFTTTKEPETSELDTYVAPNYPDNYVNIADWSNRSQWNLSNVHDPTVVLAEDGYYYMYQTDASYGNAHTAGGHFHGRRSQNLVDWEYLGGTMQSLPEWVIPKLNEIRAEMGLKPSTAQTNDFGYWAPCVRKVRDGLYRMYYSIVCPGTLNGDGTWSERAFIGLMENTNPANNDGWEDKGYVITNASDKGLNFQVASNDWANCYYKWNAIDPSYLIDNDGRHYLVYGSWHSGIAVVELDPETGKVLDELPAPWGTETDIAPYGKLIATRKMGNRWQGSEGAEVIYRDGYYYMFIAYDALEIPYNTRVARATSIEGPYYGIDGTDVTTFGGDILPVVTHPYKFSNSDGWVGISHCCVFDDGQGNWYFSSQGRFPANVDGNPYSNAIMMGQVRSIRWTEDGWPVVMPERYGAVPQLPITEDELAGRWEIIDLSYSYGNQKASTTLTLDADHTVSAGTWSGSQWSYDADKQILTINGNALYLQREVDWEASPRTHTIVFAGIGTGNITYWGKKNK